MTPEQVVAGEDVAVTRRRAQLEKEIKQLQEGRRIQSYRILPSSSPCATASIGSYTQSQKQVQSIAFGLAEDSNNDAAIALLLDFRALQAFCCHLVETCMSLI
jgi:hypothetical protein